MNRRPHICYIVPPHVLKHMTTSPDASVRDRAHQALEVAAAARGMRAAIGPISRALATASPGVKRRTVYDAKNGSTLPGKLVRSEGGKPVADKSVNQAYDFAGATYDFYSQVLGRNSIDGQGLRLDSTVHFRVKFNNAFWNGTQMVYGDGDGVIFVGFTGSVDVIGHELTHGVTQYTSALIYEDQSGALNEHFSDVVGSLVKQFVNKQTAAQADWLIGQGILAPGVKGVALRSMKAPGTAYNDPKTLGKDPQPANMANYVNTAQDNGGVHINSGIPNKAFYNAAIALGGNAWEKAGKIWYNAFTKKISPNAQFVDAANATYEAAGELFGPGKAEQIAVGEAWKAVGINIAAQILMGAPMITLRPAVTPAAAPAVGGDYIAPRAKPISYKRK
jgi:Zn-dependent metalloprotease